ncbi:hypothetical protein ACN38_g11026 [Penicillium nordicum]|uniref:Uncharacterized protein n=1 Tax=Penicillium nordicum TaxID=229535 RepID=A0A0M9WB35_9EURO|nr:hypothetical protein ACN38_g11026 [Penicillium nordicum]
MARTEASITPASPNTPQRMQYFYRMQDVEIRYLLYELPIQKTYTNYIFVVIPSITLASSSAEKMHVMSTGCLSTFCIGKSYKRYLISTSCIL